MSKKIFLIIILFLFFKLNIWAQELRIVAKEMPLNELLIQLRDRYKLNFSFDDKLLSKYKITIDKNFQNPEQAFKFMLKDLSLDYEKSENVYLFYPTKKNLTKSTIYKLSGKILGADNLESLPYSHLNINKNNSITDEYGNFNYQSTKDSIFHLEISYLGYQLLDTMIYTGLNHKILLLPKPVDIGEVVIFGHQVAYSEQNGNEAGLMRINHKIAVLIPGNGDNSVFNLLRLQPGVLAAGEQSSEMIIWGSYAGQSQINFDGMTLFGLKNFNDNISVVNPYMAKDIRIHKGGFDATLGEHIGAIVDITGIEGNRKKPKLNFNVNNMTMNTLAEIPINDKLSIVAAYRRTYYNLYSPEDFSVKPSNPNQWGHNYFNNNDIVVQPDYLFNDANFKLSGSTNSGDSYQISSFGGQDHFSYSVNEAHGNSNIVQELNEKNQQYGISTRYNKLWTGRGNTEICISFSGQQNEKSDIQNSKDMMMNRDMHSQNKQTQNNITELKAILSGNYHLTNRYKLQYGAGLIRNTIFFKQDSFSLTTNNQLNKAQQIMGYLQLEYAGGKHLLLRLGQRTDYSTNLQNLFIQPRFNLIYKPFDNFQINAAWGIYKQFIVLSPKIDSYNNIEYIWLQSDGNKIPVLSSRHYVLGTKYEQNNFSLNIETYYKQISGITRFIESSSTTTLYTGDNKTKGIDFFVKKEFKGNSLWISYSLSKSLEKFPYFSDNSYRSSFQDQRHEIKFSGIIKLHSFFISANYVYGSGLLEKSFLSPVTSEAIPYKRMDIAAIYRFFRKKIKLEAGFSVLNVFNNENIKFTDITEIPEDNKNVVSIYSVAVPFTPTLFLNISF